MTDTIQLRKRLWEKKKKKNNSNNFHGAVHLRVKSASPRRFLSFIPNTQIIQVPKATTLNERWTFDHLWEWTARRSPKRIEIIKKIFKLIYDIIIYYTMQKGEKE